ncbi:MAG: TIR domain-containing protein [Planctomycetota bacterium]
MAEQTDASPSPEDGRASMYTYDAFISYRHTRPDRKWARWLHTALETYRVPRPLAAALGIPRKLQRVFRDEEELPASADLSELIESALRESRFLIVVCSPRTPESEWVNKEIVRFREMGRDERILALLTEGEPSESFPPALREIRRTVIDAEGEAHTVIEEVEPLAADVREKRPESTRYLKRMARLRLMACILGCRFDDLRQRDQQRRKRRFAVVGALVAVLLVVLGTLGIMVLKGRREAGRQRERAISALARRAAEAANQFALDGRFSEAVRECAQGRYHEDTPRLRLLEWHAERGRVLRLHQFSDAVGGDGWPMQLTSRAAGFSTDGALLAYSTDQGSVKLRSVETGELARELKGYETSVLALDFSPDARLLAAVADDYRHSPHSSGDPNLTMLTTPRFGLKIWDYQTGEVTASIGTGRTDADYVSFAPDGQSIAIAGAMTGEHKDWVIYDLQRKKQVFDQKLDLSFPERAMVLFHPSGESVAVSRDPLTTVLWHVGKRKVIHEFDTQGEPYFSPDGRLFASQCREGGFRIWDVATGKVLHHLATDVRPTALAFSPDSQHVASATWSADPVRIWDVASGLNVLAVDPQMPAQYMAFSPDGRLLAIGGDEGQVGVWRACAGRPTRRVPAGAERDTPVAFSPDGALLAWHAGSGDVDLLDVSGDGESLPLGEHGSDVTSLRFSPDGDVLATGTAEGRVCLWDVASGECKWRRDGHEHPVAALAVAGEGARLASADADNLIRIWQTDTGEAATVLEGHKETPRALRFRKRGEELVSVAFRDSFIAWDVGTGTAARRHDLRSHSQRVWPGPGARFALDTGQSVVCLPDGNHFIVGGSLGTLRTWDVETGEWERDCLFPGPTVTSRRGHITNTEKVTVEERIQAGSNWPVKQMAIRPDGRVLALASPTDDRILFWDRKTRSIVLTLYAGYSLDGPLAFSGDGTRLAGSVGKTVTIWDLTPALHPELPPPGREPSP